MTEGPYYVAGPLLRRDITEGKPGTPLTLALTVVNVAAQHAVAAVAFWLRDIRATWYLYQKVIFIVGGMLIPLEVLPDGVEAVARALPFMAMAYVPARLASGHLEPALRIKPRDDVALGVDHCRHPRHLALDELGRPVSNHIGGPVRHQAEPTDHREHQPRGHHTGQQNAPSKLDDGDRGRRSIRRALRHALQTNYVSGRS